MGIVANLPHGQTSPYNWFWGCQKLYWSHLQRWSLLTIWKSTLLDTKNFDKNIGSDVACFLPWLHCLLTKFLYIWCLRSGVPMNKNTWLAHLDVVRGHTRFSDFTLNLHPPFGLSYERHVCIVVINGFSTVGTCNAENVMVDLKLPKGTWRRYQGVNRTI